MLSSLHVRNFKSFDQVEIELGNPVLFVGPNDAGKTSALQALMLWDSRASAVDGEARRENGSREASWRGDQQEGPYGRASPSEVLLNEAADRDVVVAFVGQPHRIDDRGSQVMKALKEIGFEDCYQAEITGFVLYLEGSTDLAVLRRFADLLGHGAAAVLQRPFVHYVLNQPSKARDHFYGLREAKSDLVGFSLFDRIDVSLQDRAELAERMWSRREIENYLCQPETLLRFAEDSAAAELEGTEHEGPLFESADQLRRRAAMEKSIQDRVPPAALRDPEDRFWMDTKASDDLLDPIFQAFYAELGIPNLMRKSDYHRLVRFVNPSAVDPEVSEVLDALEAAASDAIPAGDPADGPPGTRGP